MVISYTTRGPVINLADTGDIATEKCESLDFTMDRAMAVIIRQLQTELIDLRFAAPELKTIHSTPTN